MPKKKTDLILAPTLPAEFKVEMLPAGDAFKKDLLTKAGAILSIPDEQTRDKAIKTSSEIATYLKSTESNRKDIGNPFYEVWKKVNEIAKEHTKELVDDKDRLDRLVGGFETAQRVKLAAEQRALEQQQQALELQAAAKVNEAKAAAADTAQSGAPVLDALEAELDAENAELTAEAQRRTLENRQIELAEQHRRRAASGGMMLKEITIEVTDIEALYKARPDCVRLEPDLTQIKYLHNRGTVLPGVKITEAAKYSAKG